MDRCCWPAAILLLSMLATAPLAVAQDAALPPLTPAPPSSVNLLENPSFEAAEPDGWQFSDWPPREETGARLIADSIRLTTEQAADGDQCVVFDLTTVGADRTLIVMQRIAAEALAPHDGARMRMSAKVLLGAGPTAQLAQMTMRQWGEEGLLDHQELRITADVNEWAEGGVEFVLRMGETNRADFKVSVGQSPDLANSPVLYLDDVRLEVLAEPALAASLPWGEVVMSPDETLPVMARISQEAWESGRRALRWDLTTPDGLQSLAHGEVAPDSRQEVLSVPVSYLNEGSYALRLALGADPGERWREVLLPFVRAEGPLAH